MGDLCLFSLHSKNYERISIKFGIDIQFTIMKVLMRAFFLIFQTEKMYDQNVKMHAQLKKKIY